MAYSLKEINDAVRSDPKGFAEACDAAFAKKVETAAQKIADHAFFYCALCTHQHRHAVGQDKKRRTQCKDLKIPLCIGKKFCI